MGGVLLQILDGNVVTEPEKPTLFHTKTDE